MSGWRERLEQGAGWYNDRPVRERVLLLATTLVVLLFIGWELAVAPALSQAALADSQISDLEGRQQELIAQQAQLTARLSEDPSDRIRQQLDRREARLGELDKRIAETTDRLISPVAMVSLLKDILDTRDELVLREVRLLPPSPVYGESGNDDQDHEGNSDDGEQPEPLLYAHEAELVIEGRYLSLLAYLQGLEQMDQRLGWVSLHYDASDYDKSVAIIRVRTLSLDKAWLGV